MYLQNGKFLSSKKKLVMLCYRFTDGQMDKSLFSKQAVHGSLSYVSISMKSPCVHHQPNNQLHISVYSHSNGCVISPPASRPNFLFFFPQLHQEPFMLAIYPTILFPPKPKPINCGACLKGSQPAIPQEASP